MTETSQTQDRRFRVIASYKAFDADRSGPPGSPLSILYVNAQHYMALLPVHPHLKDTCVNEADTWADDFLGDLPPRHLAHSVSANPQVKPRPRL